MSLVSTEFMVLHKFGWNSLTNNISQKLSKRRFQFERNVAGIIFLCRFSKLFFYHFFILITKILTLSCHTTVVLTFSPLSRLKIVRSYITWKSTFQVWLPPTGTILWAYWQPVIPFAQATIFPKISRVNLKTLLNELALRPLIIIKRASKPPHFASLFSRRPIATFGINSNKTHFCFHIRPATVNPNPERRTPCISCA